MPPKCKCFDLIQAATATATEGQRAALRNNIKILLGELHIVMDVCLSVGSCNAAKCQSKVLYIGERVREGQLNVSSRHDYRIQ